MAITARFALLASALLLASCQVGGGDPGNGPGFASGNGSLTDATRDTAAAWQILDLVTGTATPRAEVADLGSNPDYRDRLLVLRRIPGGSATLGQSADFARQDDEAQRRAAVGPCYLAAFELTRAQWHRLAGAASSPWTAITPSALAGGAGDDLPATNMTLAEAQAACAAWPGRPGRLALPGADEWEAAARAGSAAIFPWGDGTRGSDAQPYALVAETASGDGPRAVAAGRPNALGLYDVVGNVWEYTADGAMRGGAWCEALALCRPANRDAMADGLAHAALGLRPAYRP